MPGHYGKVDADETDQPQALARKHLADRANQGCARSAALQARGAREKVVLRRIRAHEICDFALQNATPEHAHPQICMGFVRHASCVATHLMTRARHEGFTAIELMLVAGIVAVLAAATAPSIAAGMRGFALSTTSQEVASTIRTARYQAVGRNVTLRVRFGYPATGQYQILDSADAAVGPVRYLQNGTTFSAVSGDIQIDPQGRVTALAGALPATIVMAGADSTTRTITVSRSGRVQLP
jgi:prepilin-type N-terminal cleavage/methylation domain-containing protein